MKITPQTENQCKVIFSCVFNCLHLGYPSLFVLCEFYLNHTQEKWMLAFVSYGCAIHFSADVLHSRTSLLDLLCFAQRTLLMCSCAETSG